MQIASTMAVVPRHPTQYYIPVARSILCSIYASGTGAHAI